MDSPARSESCFGYCAKLNENDEAARWPPPCSNGRVVEHVDLSVDELQRILQRLTGRGFA